MHSFLVWHQGALGDFLLALPIFQGLYRLHSNAVIHFCTKAGYARLLATEPYFGQLLSSESSQLAQLYHDDLWAKTNLPSYFHDVNTVFVFGQMQSRVLADRLSHLLKKPIVWVQSFPSGEQRGAVTDFLLDQLKCSGWNVPYAPPMLRAMPEESRLVKESIQAWGFSAKRKPVVIHPGSGGRSKIWPLRKWYSLCQWLCADFSYPVFAVLGPADEHLKPFADKVRKLAVTVVEDFPLERLAALLAESALYIGNDSGVSHLAAVMGTPTIVIFGPTRAETWAPRGAQVAVVKSRWSNAENLILPSDSAIQEIEAPLKTLARQVLR